jgi:hypothetical protein
MAKVDMTEIVNVSGEEMIDVNMEDMSSVSMDDLMADVVEVQTVLQCNNVGQMIDANEIYEKLEELAYIDREQRVEYVATQLLHKLGVIHDSEVAPEERVFRFSHQDSEDSFEANSGCSGETSPASEVSLSDGTWTENDIPVSNKIFAGCSEKNDMTAKCINVPSTASLALVNNEKQHNSEDSNIKIQHYCCQKSDADDKTLMDEAELIHSILPHHDISQIRACLEAYKDNVMRVHSVTETFLKIDSESGGVQLSCTEVPVVNGNVECTVTSPMYDNETPSCDENLDCNKCLHHGRSLKPCNASVVSLQQTLTDADLKLGNANNSEITDKQGCQETNRNVGGGLIQAGHSVDCVTEHTYKLELEVQHNDRKVCEGDSEVMPSVLGQRVSEETVDVTSSSVEQNVSEGSSEGVPCSSSRDITYVTHAESGGAITDLTTSEPEENDTQLYMSCSDLSTIVPNLQDENNTYNIEDNLDSNMICETNGSPPSGSISQTEQSQAFPDTSALLTIPPDSGTMEPSIVQETHVELNGVGEGIGGIVTDCEMVFPASDPDGIGIFENKSQSDMLLEVEVEPGVAAVAVAEEPLSASSEQSSSLVEEHNESYDSTNSDDFFNCLGDVYEEHMHDKNVAKLHELFPDARTDYLVRISHEFDSLTDMANKVLEGTEQQNDKVGDTPTTAVSSVSSLVPSSSVSALVPGPSVSALAADAPSQGCRKKEVTYEEFQSALPHFDQELLKGIWEEIGNDYGKVKEFIAQHKKDASISDQYHTLLAMFPHADPAFLRKKCSMMENNEAAFQDFIEEQLQSKTDTQYRTLQGMFPELDPAFLRMKCDEFGDDETALSAFVVEQLQQNDIDDWYYSLLAMFPEADPAVLRESMNRIGNDPDAMRLFVTQQLDEMEGVKFQTLLAVLPDADPDYLHTTFQSIGNDENSIKEFLLEALEKKDYPTREAYLKRQEMAALQRKYKEEFSIEDFLEMFPDPWKHFYEENNNNRNELITSHGIAYLETRYGRIALDDIRSLFEKNKHNLTLTCSELDKWNGPVQPQRETYDCTVPKTEDIPVPFLQEVVVTFCYWDLDCVYLK